MIGRRKLLECSAACAALAGCGKWVDEPVAVQVGAPAKGVLTVPLARLPELAQPGGSILLHADAQDFLGRPLSVLVANTRSQGLRAYGAYCPHQGCEVAWVDKQDSVVCPCHLSTFSVDGAVTQAPAVQDLDTYGAKLSADQRSLIVDLTGAGGVFPAALSGTVTFDISDLPALAVLGGSVTGHSAGVPFPLLVIRSSAQAVSAFDARCPHLGCAVRGASKLLICPCHGSLFNLDGSLKAGPSTKPLAKLSASFDGSTVVVQVPK